MQKSHKTNKKVFSEWRLRLLTPYQVRRIDALLSELDRYGEVHVIVEQGKVKFIRKVESHKAWRDPNE